MKTLLRFKWLPRGIGFAALLSLPVHATLITNGSFESGFAGWTRIEQFGSEGTFSAQSGTDSPVNGFTVPAPPAGSFAAMSDAAGPGSRVLYQDFLVTTASSYTLGFSLFIGNGNGAPDFYTPSTLDFATPALNQRARVDLLTTSASPFSLGPDVLMTVFETAPGSPLVSGYNSYQFDVTSLLTARQGSTLRLRFTAVDNVAPFNVGIDNVSITTPAASVPDELPWPAAGLAIAAVLAFHARRRETPGGSSRSCG